MIVPCNNRPSPRLTRGFTLIELMAALTLLVVLAVLGGMTWRSVKQKAMAPRNLNNHRQIAAALIAYTLDHRGNLPNSYDDTLAPNLSFPRLLAWKGYITGAPIFFSPLEKRWYEKDGANALNRPELQSTSPWFYTNYAANRYGAMPYGGNVDGVRKPANLQRVAQDGNLSRLILLRDSYNPSNANRGGGTAWFTGAGFFPPVEKTYGGMVHASFADGHVEGFPHKELQESLANAEDHQPPLFANRYTRNE